MTSTHWDDRYASTDLVWSMTPNMWVEGVASDLPAGRALDLAAGEGRNALWLAERGWQATAVDFSQVALDRAQQFATEKLGAHADRFTTEQADLLAYAPSARAFDLVMIVYLHVPSEQRRLIVRAAAEAVAPGGRLLVIAHDSDNLTEGVGGPQDPAILYTAQDVAADLDGTGLVIDRADRLVRPVATDAGPREAIDALLLARREA